ncbi:MAG: FoF1 ATP synthase subunit delta/epsilon [Pelagibacteraceae bacterium]
MSNSFNLEIITPAETVLKTQTTEAIIPAFEGIMTILKDHISLITFLRPGLIEVKVNGNFEKYYVEEGTVEFFNNNLLILSSTIKNKKDFSKLEINKMLDDVKKLERNNDLNDKDKYVLSYKINALKEINR